jgi:phosphoribosyl 1,2-cyclic phosphate phosphodiesterase
VINNLKERFNYIFTTVNRYPGAPSVKTIAVVNDEPFQIGNKVIPVNVMHGNLQVFGYYREMTCHLLMSRQLMKVNIKT